MPSRVITLGETMALMRANQAGALDTVSELRLGIGGAESNVAIGLARLGVAVTWLGRIGDDSLGRRIARELRAEGIEVRAIVDPASPTGLMVKEHPTPGTSRVTYYRAGSAGSRLRVEDLEEIEVSTADILHVTGITAGVSETAARTLDVAVDRARSAGVAVSFDLNHRGSLWSGRDAGAVYRSIAERSSIVFAGIEEARILAPEASDPVTAARAIADLGPGEVVIKLGSEGCIALVDGVLHRMPARDIRPIDTVGAGDAFVAGYLAERVEGRPVAERLETAVTLGAFACLNEGDWEGLPRRDDLGLLSRDEPVAR